MSKLQRAHYAELAYGVRGLPGSGEERVKFAMTLCDMLARGNPLFDRARFLVACNVTE